MFGDGSSWPTIKVYQYGYKVGPGKPVVSGVTCRAPINGRKINGFHLGFNKTQDNPHLQAMNGHLEREQACT